MVLINILLFDIFPGMLKIFLGQYFNNIVPQRSYFTKILFYEDLILRRSYFTKILFYEDLILRRSYFYEDLIFTIILFYSTCGIKDKYHNKNLYNKYKLDLLSML